MPSQVYIPQPLLPSIPESVQMGQNQEQMGLLREQRDLQKQQFEQQKQQQEMTNKFNTLKTLADIDENIAIDYAEKNFTDLGIDFPKYKEDKEAFKKDIMELDPLIQRGLKGDPEAIQGFTSKVRTIQMKYPREAGKEQYKSLLSPKEQGFPSRGDISGVSPEKFTPESLSKFQQSGNYADLESVEEKKANLQYVGVSNDKDKAPVVFDPDTGGTFKNINGKLTPYSGQVEPKIEKQTTTIITPGQTATIAHGIRTEMRNNPVIKDFQDLVQKHNGMEEAYKASQTTKNFVAVDQALITFFNKATDPSSVVRESEYARTPENLSLINRVKGKANKILEGGAGLTSDERKALRDMMQSFYKIYEKEYKFTVNNYKRMAKESGINPDLVSIPYETRPQEAEPKTIVRTGTDKKTGKKVIKYSDGSMEYAQ